MRETEILRGLNKSKANCYATGGIVRGPGTATSDSIPARLSDGEAVLPAATVEAVGATNIARLIEQTNGEAPRKSLRSGGKYALGLTPLVDKVKSLAGGAVDKVRGPAATGPDPLPPDIDEPALQRRGLRPEFTGPQPQYTQPPELDGAANRASEARGTTARSMYISGDYRSGLQKAMGAADDTLQSLTKSKVGRVAGVLDGGRELYRDYEDIKANGVTGNNALNLIGDTALTVGSAVNKPGAIVGGLSFAAGKKAAEVGLGALDNVTGASDKIVSAMKDGSGATLTPEGEQYAAKMAASKATAVPSQPTTAAPAPQPVTGSITGNKADDTQVLSQAIREAVARGDNEAAADLSTRLADTQRSLRAGATQPATPAAQPAPAPQAPAARPVSPPAPASTTENKLGTTGVQDDMQGLRAQLIDRMLNSHDSRISNRAAQMLTSMYGADSSSNTAKYGSDNSLAGTKYSSDNSLAGSKYNTDKSAESSKYNTDKSAETSKYNTDQHTASSKYTSDNSLLGTVYSTDATLEAARLKQQPTDLQLAANARAEDTNTRAAQEASQKEIARNLFAEGDTDQTLKAKTAAFNNRAQATIAAIAKREGEKSAFRNPQTGKALSWEELDQPQRNMLLQWEANRQRFEQAAQGFGNKLMGNKYVNSDDLSVFDLREDAEGNIVAAGPNGSLMQAGDIKYQEGPANPWLPDWGKTTDQTFRNRLLKKE